MDETVDETVEPTGATSVLTPADTLDMITHYPNLCRSARETHEPKIYGGDGKYILATTENHLLDHPRSYKESVGRTYYEK